MLVRKESTTANYTIVGATTTFADTVKHLIVLLQILDHKKTVCGVGGKQYQKTVNASAVVQ